MEREDRTETVLLVSIPNLHLLYHALNTNLQRGEVKGQQSNISYPIILLYSKLAPG